MPESTRPRLLRGKRILTPFGVGELTSQREYADIRDERTMTQGGAT